MKKMFLAIIAGLLFYCTNAQSPQSFQYQVVVRNASGNALISQAVNFRISIISGSVSGTVEYVETHSANTNSVGVVILAIGGGTVNTGNFANINWSNSSHFIKVEADPNGGTSYLNMGTSQLLSVPYAMYAEQSGNGGDTVWSKSGNNIYNNNIGNVGVGVVNPTGRMVIKGSATALATDPLFEVKNSAGQTVFVVYQDSVNVFVNDDVIQSNRGGFAVSGRNSTKSITHNYLKVTPDKTRIYLNEDAARDGFAVMGINSGGLKDYLNVSVDTNEVINPSQPRILWYPTKEAFLTGRVLVENKDSVGLNSFASGYESKAIGNWSQALGFKSRARGFFSTAIGRFAHANFSNSFAFGKYATANNYNAYAMGDSALANGSASFSFGTGSQALGDGSFAIGSWRRDIGGQVLNYPTVASGNSAFAIGMGSTAIGNGSFAIGTNDSTTYIGAFAIGYDNTSSGQQSFSIGSYNHSRDLLAFSFGAWNNATNIASFAIGTENTVTGIHATAIGDLNNTSGIESFALGQFNTATGDHAFSTGYYTTSQSAYSLVFGRYNEIAGDLSSWVPTDPLFVLGNGSNSVVRSNAVTVLKNGNMGIGVSAPTYQLQLSQNSAAKPGSATWTITSDIRLKDVKGNYNKGLNEICKLNPIIYRYKKDNPLGIKDTDVDFNGFSAQDVQLVFPEAVSEKDGYLNLDIHSIIIAQVNAIKELKIMIDKLSKDNANLKSEVANLKNSK